MADDYWNKFEETGNVADYLYYRGVETCNQFFNEEDKSESRSESDGHGFSIRSSWGI